MSVHGSDDFLPSSARDTHIRDEGGRETHGYEKRKLVTSPWKEGDAVGDFTLLKQLGRGTSGHVFRGVDRVTGRTCALKLLLAESRDLVRLKLGFRRMMSIWHPNLLRVDRIYQPDKCTILAMEEVEGLTFAKWLRRVARQKGDLSATWQIIQSLIRDYGSALYRMHQSGLTHRDVNPSNLMVTPDNRGVLIDYGLVGTFDAQTDPNGAREYFVGAPLFLSPEVLWGQEYTPGSDIFSLGMILLDAIRTLTRGSGVVRSQSNRDDDQILVDGTMHDMESQVPKLLSETCREMLQYDRAERPTGLWVSRRGLPAASQVSLPSDDTLVGREVAMKHSLGWVKQIIDGDCGRLHLCGPSGIGKSHFVGELLRTIDSMGYAQAFFARCMRREDQPMQAFGQITDAIVNRYSRADREKLKLDPVSAMVLSQAFPALETIVSVDTSLQPPARRSPRIDSLEAAHRLSVEMRDNGPLFIIIDDVQWADQDSLNVLDRLQCASGGQLGIVTVSREMKDAQRFVPDEVICLNPHDLETSTRWLRDAADRYGCPGNEAFLERLAIASEGLAFRLAELAEELRPGGAFNQSDASMDDWVDSPDILDRLRQLRLDHLSDEAAALLPYIALAGCPVSTEQLAELTGMEDSIDAAVSELARQRLIIDTATTKECITVFHDSVAQDVIGTLEAPRRREIHAAWAARLIQSKSNGVAPLI
ncbi:MAG: AAA family ATPase, partial [Planctomycetota bacterium]